LIPLENYQEQHYNIVFDASKFKKAKGVIRGEAFIEGLHLDLNIQHEIHHLLSTNQLLTFTLKWMKGL